MLMWLANMGNAGSTPASLDFVSVEDVTLANPTLASVSLVPPTLSGVTLSVPHLSDVTLIPD